jgi:hypothetical protein
VGLIGKIDCLEEALTADRSIDRWAVRPAYNKIPPYLAVRGKSCCPGPRIKLIGGTEYNDIAVGCMPNLIGHHKMPRRQFDMPVNVHSLSGLHCAAAIEQYGDSEAEENKRDEILSWHLCAPCNPGSIVVAPSLPHVENGRF